MAKDYAKYSTKRSYKRSNRGVFKIFLVLFIAVILGSGWVFFKSEYKSEKIQLHIGRLEKRPDKTDKINKSVKTVIKSNAVATTEVIDEPEFDFYTILPKESEAVSKKSVRG